MKEIGSCPLTTHIGSMSVDCRICMEFEVTKESTSFLTGQLLKTKVQEEEYALRREAC